MSTAVSALFSPVSILLFGVSFLLLSHFIKKSTTPNFAPLPPAPKGYPVIDNLLDIPSQHVAKHFLKIHEELKSPIVRLSALGTNLIDISDLKLAKELLEKRAHINSCRASSLYFRKYVDPLSRHWTLYPHDKVHRLGRRLAMQAMSTVRAGRTLKLQTMESRCTLNNLVDIYQKGDVELWRDEMARFAASLITSAVYGFQCFSTEEPHLKELVDITNITVAGVQQPSIVNVLPFLDLIPGPMPWRSAAAANHRKRENTFYNDLAYEAIKGSRSDIDTWCKQFFLADDGDNDAALTNPKRGDRVILATQLVGAGNETTSNTLSTFTLAYLTHPEAFQGAIEQIQRVVGSDRLPEFSDRDELPLIDAIPRELLRWRPGVPSAIPHLATEDQLISFQDDSGETKEYFIPAGSLLLPNQLAIDSDPNNWDQPEKLIPERWLKDGKLVDYENYAFGWGGRVCPGQPFAERSLFISIACILWGFTAEKVNDPKTGKPFVYDDAAMTGEFTCQPLPFPCKLVPRSQRHINIIRESWEHQEKDLNNLMAWSK